MEYAPALAGSAFLKVWESRTLFELMEKIQTTMPLTAPGTLNRQQSADVIAYLLHFGKFPAGPKDLSDSGDLLSTIVIQK